jgi:cysteine desulfurase
MNVMHAQHIIYLDNAATTKPYKGVINAVLNTIDDGYGNPSSLHKKGKAASKLVQEARELIADFIHAKPSEIIFTSGGSESDNLALRGIAPYLKSIGKTTIVTSVIEHPAVLNTCADLKKDGFKIIYMPVDKDGRVDIEEFDKVLKQKHDEIGLVYIMAVNNEIGSIQLIDDIGELCHEYSIIFGTDAVQALTHIPLDVQASHIDLMAMSAHKIHGMKGIGALYVRDGITLSPIITGGGQENHLRAGTENVPGIVAFGEAIRFAKVLMNDDTRHYWNLREQFFNVLNESDIKYHVNGDGGVPNIISLTLPGCESEAMLLLLNEQNVCVSAGSACAAGSLEPSHVLKALYLPDGYANCTIRISMGGNTDEFEIVTAAQAIIKAVHQLLDMQPKVEDENG